jgi:hypothetical protein
MSPDRVTWDPAGTPQVPVVLDPCMVTIPGRCPTALAFWEGGRDLRTGSVACRGA